MANEKYDELVKWARHWSSTKLENDLADAVEQLQKERDDLRPDAEAMRQIIHKLEKLGREFEAAYHFGLPQAFAGSLNVQLVRAEQRIENLRTALSRYAAFSDTALQEVVDIGQIARAALARDEEAAKK